MNLLAEKAGAPILAQILYVPQSTSCQIAELDLRPAVLAVVLALIQRAWHDVVKLQLHLLAGRGLNCGVFKHKSLPRKALREC